MFLYRLLTARKNYFLVFAVIFTYGNAPFALKSSGEIICTMSVIKAKASNISVLIVRSFHAQ